MGDKNLTCGMNNVLQSNPSDCYTAQWNNQSDFEMPYCKRMFVFCALFQKDSHHFNWQRCFCQYVCCFLTKFKCQLNGLPTSQQRDITATLLKMQFKSSCKLKTAPKRGLSIKRDEALVKTCNNFQINP